MLEYHKIEYWNRGVLGTNVIAFDKLDGSNLRFEWNRKKSKQNKSNGFTKYGTRKQIIGLQDSNWGLGVNIFLEKYSNNLDKMFRDDKYFRNINNITCFSEYYGINSFAGWHDPKDKKDVTLFDIFLDKKGFMKPNDFVKKNQIHEIPKIIYEGHYNKSFINDVMDNKFNLKEGVVVKGIMLTKRKDVSNVWMVKVKTNQWLYRLKNIFGDEKLFEELNGDLSLFKK